MPGVSKVTMPNTADDNDNQDGNRKLTMVDKGIELASMAAKSPQALVAIMCLGLLGIFGFQAYHDSKNNDKLTESLAATLETLSETSVSSSEDTNRIADAVEEIEASTTRQETNGKITQEHLMQFTKGVDLEHEGQREQLRNIDSTTKSNETTIKQIKEIIATQGAG
jgi:predicted negative regulator of RcsB-dependent stress response